MFDHGTPSLIEPLVLNGLSASAGQAAGLNDTVVAATGPFVGDRDKVFAPPGSHGPKLGTNDEVLPTVGRHSPFQEAALLLWIKHMAIGLVIIALLSAFLHILS